MVQTTMSNTAANILAERLAQEGCRHVFGMPGGEVLVLLDALINAGIEFTLCKHENTAGYMAEGSWQASGAPGILLTTIGPGLTNAVNSIANALQEQVPLIVLSGCVARAEAESFTHQIIDQTALLTPVTKAQFQVAEGTAMTVINKALSVALADPPGPVHIDLPHNLATAPMPSSSIPAIVAEAGVWQGNALLQARTMLANACRPIVIAGVGAVHHNAGDALLALCEQHAIPLLTTYKAKGIIAEDHPLSLGGHGLSPLSDQFILPLLSQADCVVLVGYDPIEMRNGWRDPWTATVAIDISHAACEHGMHGSRIKFIGDIAGSVDALSQDLITRQPVWPDAEPLHARHALRTAFACPDDWGPHQVFDALQRIDPERATFTVDSGAHRILMSQMLQCTRPKTLLQSSAFCTMGVSVALAAGYKRAAPEAQVIAVVGDAGLEMVMGELATLRDFQLNIIIIVLVDKSLALIERKQQSLKLPAAGVNFEQTDFVAVAKAYGGYARWIDDIAALDDELENAHSQPCFVLLACRINKQCYIDAF